MYKTDEKVEVRVDGQWYLATIKATRPYGDSGEVVYTVQPVLNGDTTVPKGPFGNITESNLRRVKKTFKDRVLAVRDEIESVFGIGESAVDHITENEPNQEGIPESASKDSVADNSEESSQTENPPARVS